MRRSRERERLLADERPGAGGADHQGALGADVGDELDARRVRSAAAVAVDQLPARDPLARANGACDLVAGPTAAWSIDEHGVQAVVGANRDARGEADGGATVNISLTGCARFNVYPGASAASHACCTVGRPGLRATHCAVSLSSRTATGAATWPRRRAASSAAGRTPMPRMGHTAPAASCAAAVRRAGRPSRPDRRRRRSRQRPVRSRSPRRRHIPGRRCIWRRRRSGRRRPARSASRTAARRAGR
jgi:hypothetical protein